MVVSSTRQRLLFRRVSAAFVFNAAAQILKSQRVMHAFGQRSGLEEIRQLLAHVRPETDEAHQQRKRDEHRHRAEHRHHQVVRHQRIKRTLRVAVREAVFEVSEAKRWLLGGYNHGHIANVPYPIAMEMALGFRFTAQRFYEVGFSNRLVDADQLMPTALSMAEHLLTLPPASRVNTVHMMRQMRPAPGPEMQRLADALHDHGAKSDLMESRAAFAEKRKPNFKGWNDPEDRYKLPTLDSVK